MLPQEILAKKRDGQALSNAEINSFIKDIAEGNIADSQIGAFTMAVLLNGMDRNETVCLTKAMRDSGDVLAWDELDGPIIDKHSTGGVSDNVSLMLAPALAACGGFVPMISGRGLGHTGGTLDKFDSIPGYQTQPDITLFRQVTKQIGCAIIAQTSKLAPADKKIYAIRDVTATVASIPLITASILSKKLAAGLDALVLDVKVGSGAFMNSIDEAKELATNLVEVANAAGMKTSALITDMDHPLATAAGNAVEMQNAIDFLTGKKVDPRLWEVTVSLCTELMVSAGMTDDIAQARKNAEQAFSSGKAAEKFAKMVSALGGPNDFLERTDKYLKRASFHLPIILKNDTLIGSLGFNTKQLGQAVVELGGGRKTPIDEIDHSVGITNIADRSWDGSSPICEIWANDEASATRAKDRVLSAIHRSTSKPNPILSKVS